MSEEKNRKVEWSFSFENIGESFSNMLESVGFSGDEEIKTASFSEAKDGASSARVKLDMSIGEANITPLTDSDNLLEADVTYVGEVELSSHRQDDHKIVRLGQKYRNSVSFGSLKGLFGNREYEKLRWNVRLSRDLPLDLEINTGITSSNLHLSELQLTDLRVNAGTGKIVLSIPTMDKRYDVSLKGGTGELRLDVPTNAEVDLDVSNGTGATHITFASNVAAGVKISGGVGSCNLVIPADAAVRIKASTGIGSIHMPDHFRMVKGGKDFISTSGTWETPGYELAERKITIKYSGGIGKLSVSSPRIV